jgi:hypothetical protein
LKGIRLDDIYQKIRSADPSQREEYIAKYKIARRKDIAFFLKILVVYAIFTIFFAESLWLVDIIDKIDRDIATVFNIVKEILVYISMLFVLFASFYAGRKASELIDSAANGPPIWHQREFSILSISLGIFVGLATYGVLFVGFTKGLGINLLQFVNN